MKSVSDLGLARRLLLEARPYWSQIGAYFVLSLLAAPLALLAPVPLQVVVDHVLGDSEKPAWLGWVPGEVGGLLLAAVLLQVGIALAAQLQAQGVSLLHTFTGQRMVLDFRARLFRKAQRLSLGYHDRHGSTDSIYKILYDAPAIQHVAIDGVVPLVTALVTLVAIVVVTARLDPMMAWVALSVAPIVLVLSQVYRRRLRDQWHRVKKLESSAHSVVQEVLGSLRVVKAFGQEDREADRFVAESGASLSARLKAFRSEAVYSIALGMTTAGGLAIALYVGAGRVREEVLSLGQLLLVMAYLNQMYGPIKTLGKKAATLQSSLVSAERVFRLMDEPSDVLVPAAPKPIGRARGHVEMDGVGFCYDDDQAVLDDISFVAEPGERIGIAGRTGAGKTTLMSLLCRFYDPTRGRILLDGVDLRELDPSELRAQFGIVLQEPVLFSTTIAENIAYAKPGASLEEIREAARAANADEFICGLEDGYSTRVGERGVRLSGGERQRVSLARAFLKDAPILILDEPTSSVDVLTEAGIIEAMDRLMVGRTTFMIAHRLTTLENCDTRIVIEHGRLVDPDQTETEFAASLRGVGS